MNTNPQHHGHDDHGAAPGTPWPAGAPSGPHAQGDAEPWRCHARSKQTGNRCGQRAMLGQRVCYAHGGRNPKAKAAAARRLEAERVGAEVAQVLEHETPAPVTEPLAVLAELAGEAVALKSALSVRVAELGDGIRYTASGTGTEQLRAEVALYERAMDRAGRFLDLLAKSGFEERRVRVSEEQGAQVHRFIIVVMEGMLTAVRAHLRAEGVPEHVGAGLAAMWEPAYRPLVLDELRKLTEGGQ